MSQPEPESNKEQYNDSGGREDILNSSLMDCNIGLPVFPAQYQYLMVSNYEILATIGSAEEAETFISDYSTNSGSEWRVLRTFTKLPATLVYKRAWRCQCNVQQRRKAVRDLNKIKVSKNFQCPGYICVSVYSGKCNKKGVPDWEKDPMAKVDNNMGTRYTCSIKLNLDHNHSLTSKDVLRHRTLDPSIKDKIMNMFHYGHGASAAIKLHLLDLLMINEDQYFSLIQDGRYMPSVSQIQHYLNNVKPKLELYSVKDIIDQYTLRNPEAQVRNFYVQSEANNVITVMTPLMSKVHRFESRSGEILSITLSPKLNRVGIRLLSLSTHSSVGALPLGLIILQQHEDMPGGKENVLRETLEEFTSQLTPETCFHGLGYPRVILTEWALVPIVSKVWPRSIVLVSQASALQTVWTWLQDGKNGIHFTEREGFFYSFKKIMSSKSSEAVEKNFSRLVQYCSDGCPSYLKFVESLMVYKAAWIDFYRREKLRKNGLEHITLEESTQPEVEIISGYVFNQMLLKIRNLLSTLPEVLNFVLNHVETYYNVRLLKFVNAKHSSLPKSMLSKYLDTDERLPANFSIQASDFDADCYFLVSKQNNFYVDAKHQLCSCSKKMLLGPCVHISTVLAHAHKTSKYVLVEQSVQDSAQSLLTEPYARLKVDEKSIIVINTYSDPKDTYTDLRDGVNEEGRYRVKTEQMGESDEEDEPGYNRDSNDGELNSDQNVEHDNGANNVNYTLEYCENSIELGETLGESDNNVEEDYLVYSQLDKEGNDLECSETSGVHVEYVTLDALSDLEYDLTEANESEPNLVEDNDDSTAVVETGSLKRKQVDDVNTTERPTDCRSVRPKLELNTSESRSQITNSLVNQIDSSQIKNNVRLKGSSGNQMIPRSPSKSNSSLLNSSGKLVTKVSELSSLKELASQIPGLFSGSVVQKKLGGDQEQQIIFLQRHRGYETEVKYCSLEQKRDAVVSLSDNVIIIDPKLSKADGDVEADLNKLADIYENIKSNPSQYKTVLRNMISVYETFCSDV